MFEAQHHFNIYELLMGELCVSHREACQRLEPLENGAHWDQTLNDAVIFSQAHQIQALFSIIISTCFPSKPIDL